MESYKGCKAPVQHLLMGRNRNGAIQHSGGDAGRVYSGRRRVPFFSVDPPHTREPIGYRLRAAASE